MNKRILGMFIVGFFLTAHSANAAVINVPSVQYPTIVSAMKTANYGDSILVGPGKYREYIVMKPGVRLIGSGPSSTTILADPKDSTSKSGPVRGASYSTLKGFTINRNTKAAYPDNACLVLSNVRHMIVSNIEINGNIENGIMLQNSNYNTIQFVKAVPAASQNIFTGLYLYSSSYNHILRNNLQTISGGIFINTSHYNKLEHNLAVLKPSAAWRSTGGGIHLHNSEGTILIHNTGIVLGNVGDSPGAGLVMSASPLTVATNNIFFGPEGFRNGIEVQRATWDTRKPDLTISYSVVKGSGLPDFKLIDNPDIVKGPGVLSIDPKVNLTTGVLLPSSPSINKGDPALPKDPDGSIADLGAFFY